MGVKRCSRLAGEAGTYPMGGMVYIVTDADLGLLGETPTL